MSQGTSKERPHPTIITLANTKGGVGKTATAAHLGGVLAQLGFSVCLIDLDKRAGLTKFFDYKPTSWTSADLLTAGAGLEEVAVQIRENLWLVPATNDIERAEIALAKGNGGEVRLKKTFRDFPGHHDFTFLDTPGDWNIITRNGIMASTHMIVPINSEPQAMTDAVSTIASAQDLVDYYAHDLKLMGVLLTHYRHTVAARTIEASACSRWPNEMFETRIRRAERINELAIMQQTTADVSAAIAGAVGEDYARLAREVIERA
jgi:chromosome partitioning protein